MRAGQLASRRQASFPSVTSRSSLNQVGSLATQPLSELSSFFITVRSSSFLFPEILATNTVDTSSSFLNRSQSVPNGYSRLSSYNSPQELSPRGKRSSGYGSPDHLPNSSTQTDLINSLPEKSYTKKSPKSRECVQ